MNLPENQIGLFALLSCAGWIAMFAAKKTGHLWLGNCLGILYHLALAPVIRALPAPAFVRIAGYVRVYCDALIGVASINSMGEGDIWALRNGVHIPASIWIVGSSLQMPELSLAVGVLLYGLLGLHAVAGPSLSNAKMKLYLCPSRDDNLALPHRLQQLVTGYHATRPLLALQAEPRD